MNAVQSYNWNDLPLVARIRMDPWEAVRQGMVITHDELDEFDPYKPFPDKGYLEFLKDEWLTKKFLLIHKSRRMMMTWLFVYLFFWDVFLNVGRKVAFQSQKEAKSDELLDKAQVIYEHMDPAFWGGRKPEIRRTHFRPPTLEVPELGGMIIGIAEGEHQLNQYTLSGVLMDESQLWTRLIESYSGARPTTQAKRSLSGLTVSGRITIIGTGKEGTEFQRMCYDDEV